MLSLGKGSQLILLNKQHKENMKDINRFLSKVEKIPFTDCWIWNGALKNNGYGDFYLNGKVQTAHRASYQLFVGLIENKLDVCHKCDVRHCVNPNHLFLGTRKENMLDAVRKKRIAKPLAKLTQLQAEDIKKLDMPNYLIAKKYAVSQNIVCNLKNGRYYK